MKRLGLLAAVLSIGVIVPNGLINAPPASATHNRASQMTWSSAGSPGKIDLEIEFVARRSYYDPQPNTGDTVTDPFLDWGDGSAAEQPELNVDTIDEGNDIIFASANLTHTYANAGDSHTIALSNCCRLRADDGHINNPDRTYRVTTVVTPNATHSPSVSLAPIIDCQRENTCSFQLSGSSGQFDTRWRLATANEATGGQTDDGLDEGGDFVQPGPPDAPNAASVNATSGVFTWNARGATFPSGKNFALYSTQVIVEHHDKSNGALVASTAVDFFIRLSDTLFGPRCVDTDGNGAIDNDNDGLCDNWETSGIDANNDGTIDLQLNNANVNRPDIYVEVDYMEGRKPSEDALKDVVEAFASHGFTLHTEMEQQVPHHAGIYIQSPCTTGCASDSVFFDDVKDVYFGKPGESTLAKQARASAYHYALYADRLGNEIVAGKGATTGVAEIFGNDLVIANVKASDNRRSQAGTFMHELGHNLDLRHGGADHIGCKPNYLSVMNYTRQLYQTGPSGQALEVALDYSDAALGVLDEGRLDEPNGVGGPSNQDVAYSVKGVARIAKASGPINWDGVGDDKGIDVQADINYFPGICGNRDHSPSREEGLGVLEGHNDWATLRLDFRNSSDFADGVHASLADAPAEINLDEVIAQNHDADGDHVVDELDNCPLTPNSDQADANGDGFGDVCPGGVAPVATIQLSAATVTPGSAVTVSGTGFAASKTIDLTLLSDPVALGSIVTEASGRFTYQVTIPSNAPVGAHIIEASVRGETLRASAPLTVTAAATTPTTAPASTPFTTSPPSTPTTIRPQGPLSVTGADGERLALYGVMTLLMGFGLVLAARPRRYLLDIDRRTGLAMVRRGSRRYR